ncbi:uncharacterized protein LOC122859727 [Aphidius gifuensis]|uniref:uncharacterized protein LOC122859727 n=1 Tax=Aphidius gifuensis TaxID=684658 RepID=UPI001CDCFFB4|nr:uncharacterized protein LOC122859727 [Aphidius gifuensis]
MKMEKKNIVTWLNEKIASLQKLHLQHDQDVLSRCFFIYPPEVGQRPNKFSEDYLKKQRDARIKSIDAAFDKFPTLEKICKDWSNNVVDSVFRKFIFKESQLDTGELEIREHYFINFVNLAGHNLTHLDVGEYAYSRIMQSIKIDCPNLESLDLVLKEIKSEDFENFFSNMSHLKSLTIVWKCEDSTLPETLVKSLEQAGETLEHFEVQYNSEKIHLCLPYSLASKIITLSVDGTNITDNGIIALNNLKQLERFNVNSWGSKVEKLEFITGKSIQYLFNENLRSLRLSNCIKITNISVIKLLENLPNLDTLYIDNTKVTYYVVEEISKLSKYREKELDIYVSFKDCDRSFSIIRKSHNIVFLTV